ncbi:MAG: hypothetical protein PUG09_07405 [Prevotella sp.]|nr:hypothetical protein [Prevotella sp.]
MMIVAMIDATKVAILWQSSEDYKLKLINARLLSLQRHRADSINFNRSHPPATKKPDESLGVYPFLSNFAAKWFSTTFGSPSLSLPSSSQ